LCCKSLGNEETHGEGGKYPPPINLHMLGNFELHVEGFVWPLTWILQLRIS